MDRLMRLFGVQKPVVAMMHFPGLPGRPLHDAAGGPDALLEPLARDLAVLQDAGVDGLLFCNEKDYPYQLKVGPEIPAAMAAIIGRLQSEIHVPFGVNVLFDPIASLALARATGAAFVREVLTGVYESDLGIIEPHVGDIMAYRSAIGAAGVALFDNISPEFSSALGTRTLADRARGAAFFEMDAILISGWAAGSPMEMADLVAAKQAVPQTPVIANTGVRTEHIAQILEVADGVIVGSSLKRDGVTWNPVDHERAMRFMDAVRAFRARTVGA
ncbi:MAG: BtpA/SgcQ family protein [Candidatus Limnocylindrales bacterium]